MITTADVENVAKSINQQLTAREIDWVLVGYEEAQRQDPTGSWNLVVEDIIHQCVEMRKDKERYDLEIVGEDASTDDCWFDRDDEMLDMGTQII